MKKLLTLLLTSVMALALVACGGQQQASSGTTEETKAEETATEEVQDVDITLWVYPVGGWGNEETVASVISKFEAANPGIKVAVEYLAYADGDDKVNTAIEGNEAPDLIMEGPERLVANWGAKGYMVDLTDIFDGGALNPATAAAAKWTDGKIYEYPVCMTAHCMAVNLTRLQAACDAAGVDLADILDKDNHTWTTEQFFKAVELLHANNPGGVVGALYCSGQGGDQGTRALVNNLYGGTFTNPEHTKYTANSPENIKALEELYATPGINFDASINGGEEIANFYNGIFDMAFCWNIAQQLNPNAAGTGAGKTANGEDILFMSFPSQKGNDAKLQGGIWGFGIFDNGDANKIAASKKFIEYFCKGDGTADAVAAANFFPVRDVKVTYASDADILNEYSKLMPLLGDYYQVTVNWPEARTAWWNMLQRIGAGGNVADEVAAFEAEVNK